MLMCDMVWVRKNQESIGGSREKAKGACALPTLGKLFEIFDL